MNSHVPTQADAVTLANCDFRNAQYHGGGGNGYLYTFSGNDCLIRDSYAENGRHNYDFQNMWCSTIPIAPITGIKIRIDNRYELRSISKSPPYHA
jgi:hypothetical protein